MAAERLATRCPQATVLLWLPWLLVQFQSGNATCDGITKETITVPVRGDASDAFQYKKTGITYSGSSGEVYVGRSAYHGNVVSALRFSGVRVPKGARIAAARVRLVDAHAGTVCCKGTDLTVLLRLEKAAGSTPLPRHHTPGWLLSRLAMTASKTWQPPALDTFNATYTPDFSEMVQSIVGLKAWAPGNAITLLLDGEGETNDVDERVYYGSAVSFQKHRAVLEITFCKPPPQPEIVPETEIIPMCPPAPKCEQCSTIAMQPTSADGVVVMADTTSAAEQAPHLSVSSAAELVLAMAVLGAAGAIAVGTWWRRQPGHSDEQEFERRLPATTDDFVE